MSTTVLFEHPLNEKMRTWLRIEFLLKQLTASQKIVDHLGALTFFRNAAELLDVFERGELRTEILKELERQQQKLLGWADVPGVDMSRINMLRGELKQCGAALMAAPRTGQALREERLIGLVRQRLSIPGGCCSFDLPTLHIWLHIDQSLRDQQVTTWINSLAPIQDALTMILDLIRQSGIFRNHTSLNGFFQDNAEGADLLRMQLRLDDALYPQISGHKSRYAIRFLPLDSERGEVPARFDFELACC
ncbi:MAG TPA: cell division protein ZapD [Erwinia persicina]|uniref:Cell division protein ZapD n=1 Tax=Erwinia persicina TaxID=55211 RepID=A0A3S7S6N7_9GAMM|nr:cell division protein ZapD [Erwinia persicina]AXU96373.1 cell division protein ZapD [Erwinia persicina]MBD8105953.1 cell division protein ZapD [Erwinia persicina]MBD8168336.1 cell division protein ZapD [Erwinia persicina]MBD8208904.1 cell division protein ZapD [Erwinia persicina]MCQ4094083.1 cell division protein ZapD [Erwinia persicina]